MTQKYADQLNQQVQKILARNKEVREKVSEFLKSEGFSSEHDVFRGEHPTYTLRNRLFEATVVLGDLGFSFKVTGSNITNLWGIDRLNSDYRFAYTADVIEQYLVPVFNNILEFLREHEQI